MRIGAIAPADLLLASVPAIDSDAAVVKRADDGGASSTEPGALDETVQASSRSNIFEPLMNFGRHKTLEPLPATHWEKATLHGSAPRLDALDQQVRIETNAAGRDALIEEVAGSPRRAVPIARSSNRASSTPRKKKPG